MTRSRVSGLAALAALALHCSVRTPGPLATTFAVAGPARRAQSLRVPREVGAVPRTSLPGEESATWGGASLGAVAAVAIASAGLAARSRQRDVSAAASKTQMKKWRFKRTWEQTRKVFKQHNVEMPSWMTKDRWQALHPKTRCQKYQYYLRCFDDQGEPTFDFSEEYAVERAVNMIFDWQEKAPMNLINVQVNVKLNLDQRQPDQQMRTVVNLPHSMGEKKKVAVFCNEADAPEVMKLGAHSAGDALEQAIKDNNIDFDMLITTPQMMPRLARLGKVLGPRKLMPSPKTGTVTTDIESTLKDFTAGGLLECRTGSHGDMRLRAGQLSMSKDQVLENVQALLRGLAEKAPPGAVKPYWESLVIHSSQSQPIRCRLQGLPQPDFVEEDEEEDDLDW